MRFGGKSLVIKNSNIQNLKKRANTRRKSAGAINSFKGFQRSNSSFFEVPCGRQVNAPIASLNFLELITVSPAKICLALEAFTYR